MHHLKAKNQHLGKKLPYKLFFNDLKPNGLSKKHIFSRFQNINS